MTRLPDIIITGVKKCGTKTIQMFLLNHPKIFGTKSENFSGNLKKNFPEQLAAWFEKMNTKALKDMIN
jgi:hypothetical protein